MKLLPGFGWKSVGTVVIVVSIGLGHIVTRLPASSGKSELRKDLEYVWLHLADENEAQAHTAMWEMMNRGDETVDFLGKKLRPVSIDTSGLNDLIGQLDDDSFFVRDQATQKLLEIGPIAEPELRKTLKITNSAEVRARCNLLIGKMNYTETANSGITQFIRSVRVLECIGSQKAVALLKKLAGGTPGAYETRSANEALKWIRRRSENSFHRDATVAAVKSISQGRVGRYDWPQWGGWSGRNNTPFGENIPQSWNVNTARNIKWSVAIGSQTYGNPSVANGKVFIGTNNGAGYLKRFPPTIDLGVLLCFDEKTGAFLWQFSVPVHPAGRAVNWPAQGLPSTPLVDGDRLWIVTNRCEVVCLDTEGFLDGENDGPYKKEVNQNRNEADVVWKFDMMGKLGVTPHNMSTCSITSAGDILFVSTSNGVDAGHINLPAPDAPSFLAMDRNNAKILWKDNSPGRNILHGQWSSPAYAVLGGQPQVLFAGGDGWLYSFDPLGDGNGKSKLLWKFDLNPKHSKWILGGRGTRNNIIGFPAIYDGLVYIAAGQDPEHGEGMGHLWCIDPTKRGDVSSELAIDRNGKLLPQRRLHAVDFNNGDRVVKNPRSAAVWHYGHWGEKDYDNAKFEHQMHRTLSTPVIKDDLLYIPDFTGLFHCLDSRTGKRYWSYDMFSSCWGSALVVDGKVYVGNEIGEIAVFPHTADPAKAVVKVNGELRPSLGMISMEKAVYPTPVVANNVLFISTKNRLYAIEDKK